MLLACAGGCQLSCFCTPSLGLISSLLPGKYSASTRLWWRLASACNDHITCPGHPSNAPPPPSNSTERFSSGAGWEQILGKSYKEHQTNQAARLGRGKREKTQARNKDGGFQTLLRSGAEPAFVCPEPLARGPYLVVCCFLCYSMTSAALAGWTNEITPFATGRWLTVKRFSSIQPGFRLCVCLCVRMLCVGLVLTSAPHAPDCAGTAVRRGR